MSCLCDELSFEVPTTLGFLFVLVYGHRMQTLLGQGSNPYHNSSLSHSSDITRCLTCCTPMDSRDGLFLVVYFEMNLDHQVDLLINFPICIYGFQPLGNRLYPVE